MCFFFKQKTAYEMCISDWSSDVCASDLAGDIGRFGSLAISLFNDRETDIAGLLQRIAEPVVQCFAIEGKISIECQGRPGHLMPAVRAAYRVPTRKRRRRPCGGGAVSGHVGYEPVNSASAKTGRASCRERVCKYV